MLFEIAELMVAPVHLARPEINCVAHAHSVYGRAFCSLGRNVDMLSQDATAFHNDIALYTSYEGVVLATKEGKNIAKCLGPRKAALLQNHGLLTCAKSVEATTHWFIQLEKICQVQLLADAAAGGRGSETVKIPEEDAAYTRKLTGSELAGYLSASPLFELMEGQMQREGVE